MNPGIESGYARISRKSKTGDVLELVLPMPARRVYAHPKVEADRGRVALMRGPLVYCLEDVDNRTDVSTMVLPKEAKLTAEHREDLLGGVTVVTGATPTDGAPQSQLTAVPYYVWNNRQPGKMVVWIIEDADRAK